MVGTQQEGLEGNALAACHDVADQADLIVDGQREWHDHAIQAFRWQAGGIADQGGLRGSQQFDKGRGVRFQAAFEFRGRRGAEVGVEPRLPRCCAAPTRPL